MNDRALYQPAEAKAPDALALTRMWGATKKLSFTGSTPIGGVTIQLADIRLPEPVTAAMFFQGIRAGDPGVVAALTIDMFIGLGRTNVKRSQTFLLQPTPGVPLVFLVPAQPVAAVQVIVTGTGNSLAPGDTVEVDCTFQLAPITRIQYEKEALKFGMALPGEADGFDATSMDEELEEHAPDRAHIMRARQAAGRHPLDNSDGEEGDEGEEYTDDQDDDRPNQIMVPPQFERSIERISARLGRPAKVGDLPPALRARLMRSIRRSR